MSKIKEVIKLLEFIVDRENLTFAECVDAEEIMKAAHQALDLLRQFDIEPDEYSEYLRSYINRDDFIPSKKLEEIANFIDFQKTE